ncbi:hypothetical protein Mgra_00002872 [Meloidogyne graminicola]|uniref:FLYWCH-type domain-containing protein n=1 Tax=Meloidogyne graminicola TaxID=189291 RepID=A0A8S9ZX31_9BILA|nr:hypothetical protein Mgra_00002872 [Meloidogyne graminicola]
MNNLQPLNANDIGNYFLYQPQTINYQHFYTHERPINEPIEISLSDQFKNGEFNAYNPNNGDQLFFFKTNYYKCFTYTRDKIRVNSNNYKCANYHNKKCTGRLILKKNPVEIIETGKHTCQFSEIRSHEIKKNICVKPGVDNKKISYCIFIEYNIKGYSKKITNFVGTQEVGIECKEQKFRVNKNIENIIFIVVWSENDILPNEKDNILQSRFNFIVLFNITFANKRQE